MVVDNLSVEIREGEIFGLLGPNGAGKTTSIRMITGLLQPDSGEVMINGKRATGNDNRLNVGLCPQELVLWNNLTCREQLIFIAAMYNVRGHVAHHRADELLERMHLTEKRNRLARTLSGGMQRRLNILMALMHDPGIIILDEPEAGLDPQSRVLVREFILSLSKIKTVVFTTHNMDEAERVCDRIAIIDSGKLLVTGSPDNLKKTIGKGDVLEIMFSGNAPATSELAELSDEVKIIDSVMYFKSLAVIDKLPSIIEGLKSKDIKIKGINLRENTLEDVFISLTGKKLRD
ncbi:MAG: antibiotic transport system ATP-binding protein [Bacteroidetes bacterium]|nr:MAG: antibiotic transport system ATP-binding protein [Bacteroidota bacterium]